jgi:hypothetical protein
MARKPRIEYDGAFYHIITRGNQRQMIFKDPRHLDAGRKVKPFDITGRPMAGWVLVEEAGWKCAAGLAKWMGIGKEFALSLPEKKGKVKAKRTKTLREYKY